MRKRTVVGTVLSCSLVLGVAAAVGGPLQQEPDPSPVLTVREPAVNLPAEQGNAGAAHQTSSAALRAHLELGRSDYLNGTDWESAQSFAIPGTRLRGWTFDQQDKRCLAIPDPVAEGYGVACKTGKEIDAGDATVIITPPAGSGAPNVVGVLESATAQASVDAPTGTATQFERIGDVYVGIAPTGSRLVTAAGEQTIEPPKEEPALYAPPPVR